MAQQIWVEMTGDAKDLGKSEQWQKKSDTKILVGHKIWAEMTSSTKDLNRSE